MRNIELARRFRMSIASNDYQLQHVAKMSKMSRNALYDILHNDDYDPRFSTVERLAKFLDVNIDEYIRVKKGAN